MSCERRGEKLSLFNLNNQNYKIFNMKIYLLKIFKISYIIDFNRDTKNIIYE